VNRFTVLVALVLTVALVLCATVLAKDQVRRARWRMRFRLHPGPGFANTAEIQLRWSRMAAIFHGRRARPTWECCNGPRRGPLRSRSGSAGPSGFAGRSPGWKTRR
jgi:hypothetical protein